MRWGIDKNFHRLRARDIPVRFIFTTETQRKTWVGVWGRDATLFSSDKCECHSANRTLTAEIAEHAEKSGAFSQ